MINKTSSILAFISIAQLAIGLFLQLYIIKILGVGEFTDAFIAAQTIPAIISVILITVFQSVYLPSLSIKATFNKRWKIEQGKAHAKLFIIFGILALIFILTANIILQIIFQGFTENQIEITKTLFIFLMFSFWLNTHSHIFAITLRTIDKFILADSIILIESILNFILISLFLSVENINILGMIYFITSLIIFIILYIISGKPKLIFKNIFKNNKNWKMMMPLIRGNMIYKTSSLVDRYLLSTSFSGAMTLYNIANIINSSFTKIADKLIIITYLPKIAKLIKYKNINGLNLLYSKITKQILFLSILILVSLFFIQPFWHDITFTLFKMTREHSEILFILVWIMVSSFFGSMAGVIQNNIFYAYGNPKTITNIGIINYILFIPIKIILFYKWGLIGLGIAQTLFIYTQFGIIYYYMKKFKYLNTIEEDSSSVLFK